MKQCFLLVSVSLFTLIKCQTEVGIECPSPVVCVTEKHFTFCHVIDGLFVLQNETYMCPEGYKCTNDPYIPCRTPDVSIETTTFINTVPATPPAKCTSPSKYPAPKCNQYYECKIILLWYKLELKTCREGNMFDPDRLKCVPLRESDCILE